MPRFVISFEGVLKVLPPKCTRHHAEIYPPLKRLEREGVAIGFYGFSQRRMRPFVKRIWNERFEVTGAEHVPLSGSAVLAANQTTHLDPLFLAVALRRPIHFVGLDDAGKLEPWYTPFLYRSMGVIIVTDSLATHGWRLSIAEVDDAVRYGELMGIFPEGRLELKTDRSEIGQFHKGVVTIAKHHNLPIIPILMRGTEAVMPNSTPHLRGKIHVVPVSIKIGEPILPTEPYNEESIRQSIMALEDSAPNQTAKRVRSAA